MSIAGLLPKVRCASLAGRAALRYCHAGKVAVEVSATANSVPKDEAVRRLGAIRRLLSNVNALIEELSHMDEVRAAQAKVIQIKDKLFDSSQQKREIQHKLSEIRRDLKRVHADSVTIQRGTDAYLALVHTEISLLKEEDQLQGAYSRQDDEERNLFTHLSAAINDAYEKEKVHSNTLRLWALIGTIVTSLVTLVLSSVSHYYHTAQIGLVGSKLKDADNIFSEIRSQRAMLMELQQSCKNLAGAKHPPAPTESWTSYFSRHLGGVYRYFFPRKQ